MSPLATQLNRAFGAATGKILFFCGVALIYSGFERSAVLRGLANVLSDIWLVLAGFTLISVSLLRPFAEESALIKYIVYGFTGASVPLWMLVIVLHILD